MSDVKKTGLIRKVSAVLATALVNNSIGSLFASDVPPGQWLFGFDPTQPEHEADVFACDADGTREWSQHTTEPFFLRTWGAQKVLLPETAEREEREAVRVVLIDPTGDTLSFVSVGVVNSLDLIRALRGDGPFEPALPIVVVQIKTGVGRQILKLRPIFRPMATGKK
jgi:hypothetical protein